MKVLLLNAGSSSLKGVLRESSAGAQIASASADWAGSTTRYRYSGPDGAEYCEKVAWTGHAAAVRRFVHDLTSIEPVAVRQPTDLAAVGHRVVHGGPFTSSVLITPQIRAQIAALVDLAPLHNPPSLETLAASEAELSHLPQIAVFDTAFHSTLAAEAYVYPVPQRWTHDWGIRRYGFHGLSHAYCSRRAAEILSRPVAELRLVICHLGHGCSAAAVRFGQSVDTTMGFTPLEGLMMATRSGSVDPSILLHVQQRHKLTVEQLEKTLNRESGLLGVSGTSADMREVLAAARSGHEQSRLAIAIYTRRIRQSIGALTVTMGGIDAIVLTAGVGENSPEVRAEVCAGLDCLGIAIDERLNASCRPDADISSSSARARVLVVATREDMTMLREVVDVLSRANDKAIPS